MPFGWQSGTLLKEQSRPEVWLVLDEYRLHVPSPYSLEALGFHWPDVHVVNDGSLDHIPSRLWESLSITPGSLYFSPDKKVYHPLKVSGSRVHRVWGDEVAIIALQGWLVSGVSGPNGDPDFFFNFELDLAWALREGLPVDEILRVGNILQHGKHDAGSTPRAAIASPRIHVEVSGSPWKDLAGRPVPPDWRELPNEATRWPYDPRNIRSKSGESLAEGHYVRMVGSLLTDQPHKDGEDFAHVKEGIELWYTGPLIGGHQNSPGNLARWTEMHPPDSIEIIKGPDATETVRAVAVVAPGTWPLRPRPQSTLHAEIVAPPRPPGRQVLKVQEILGFETDVDCILEGNATRSGARMTILSNPDRVALYVTIGGNKDKTAGRFKAIYRVYWELQPDPPPPPPDSVRVPGVVGARQDEARKKLRAVHLEPRFTGASAATNAEVIWQNPEDGARVSRGTVVTCRLLKNNDRLRRLARRIWHR